MKGARKLETDLHTPPYKVRYATQRKFLSYCVYSCGQKRSRMAALGHGLGSPRVYVAEL